MSEYIVGIHGISIVDKKILLVKKGEVWILPGGKLEPEESDSECLVREIVDEELPFYTLSIGALCNIFFGITPHSNKEIKDVVYWVTIKGNIAPSPDLKEKIKDANYFSFIELYKIKDNVSEITQKIILYLIEGGYL